MTPLAEGQDGRKVMNVVLVVDDEPEVVRTISRMLVKLGYAVSLPKKPFVAEEIAAIPCDIIMTDLVMTPEVSGYDVIRELRLHRPFVPIIAFSGKGPYIAKELGELAGADVFLPKPVTLDNLQSALQQALTSANGPG